MYTAVFCNHLNENIKYIIEYNQRFAEIHVSILYYNSNQIKVALFTFANKYPLIRFLL